jgi:hypothetical protein
MGTEQLEYVIALDDGPDAEVLGRLAHLDLGAAAYMAAVARHPNRNVRLLQGEQILKRHDGEPKPELETPTDPNLKSWSVHLIGGRKMQHLGFVQADDAESAVIVAAERFTLTAEQRKRLAVNPQR